MTGPIDGQFLCEDKRGKILKKFRFFKMVLTRRRFVCEVEVVRSDDVLEATKANTPTEMFPVELTKTMPCKDDPKHCLVYGTTS